MARKEKKYHFIYKTTNLLSGKYYIGMHSTDNLEDGYLGSGNRLRLAIRKHGKENFSREILEFFDTRELLAEREAEVVNLEEVANRECMNLRVGGEGGWSENANKAFKEKLANDDKFREEFSKKSSERMKNRIKSGEIDTKSFGFKKGYKHTEESKKKMSEVQKGKNAGTKNPAYGTCLITKGEENKRIEKDELDIYISEGWKKGVYLSDEELNKINDTNKKRRKVERPPYEQLIKEIEELGLSGTGRKYGVHYTAIKQWRLHYETYISPIHSIK